MKKRKVFKKIGDKWEQTSMPFLRKGDIFKMFESNGEQVKDGCGETRFTCESDAYENKHEVWVVDVMYTGYTIPPDEAA